MCCGVRFGEEKTESAAFRWRRQSNHSYSICWWFKDEHKRYFMDELLSRRLMR
jgi:hypothetical protein